MKKQMSEKQRVFFAYLKDYFAQNSISPTFEEIKRSLKIKHNSTIIYYLKQLEDLGLIYKKTGSRGINLTEDISFSKIPVLGYANAGYPTALAEEDLLGYVTVDKRITKNKVNIFSLIIKGDSMNKAKINGKLLEDGHYVVIDKDKSYEQGSIVVAIIDGAATIKKLDYENNNVQLLPNSTNPIHHPIFISDNENLFINGVVIDVL